MSTTCCAWTLCLATLGLDPNDDVVLDRVDLVEINHFHDDQGRLILDQLIFYDWSPADSRYHVRAWRRISTPAQIPLRNWRNRDFVAIWHDGKDRDVLRKVHARMIRETWTQYDPELVEREFLPQEKRRDLRKLAAIASLDQLEAAIGIAAKTDSGQTTIRR